MGFIQLLIPEPPDPVPIKAHPSFTEDIDPPRWWWERYCCKKREWSDIPEETAEP